MVGKIPVDDIKIEKRIRRELGDIEALAEDIEKNGLINPPVITPDRKLIAGERRLRACKMLGWEEIEVRIMEVENYRDKLRLEISENENRKSFTFSEKMDWAEKLERVERIKAEKRMKNPTQNFAEGGETREKVADRAGFGNRETYRKAKYIIENADEELINELDEEEISIHSAYKKLKKEKDRLKKSNEDLTEKLNEIKEDKKVLKKRIGELEEKNSSKESEELQEQLDELKEDLKKKKKTVRSLKSKLAEVGDSERKIATQKIKDRCREMITENGKYIEEIKMLAKENEVDSRKAASALYGLQDNLDSLLEEAKKLIKHLKRGDVIDV